MEALALRLSERLGGGFCTGDGTFCQALSHACLPAWPGGAPPLNDLWGQAKADELARVFRAGATTPFHDCPGEQFIRQFRKFLVLVRLDLMHVYVRHVRAQSTARGEFAHYSALSVVLSRVFNLDGRTFKDRHCVSEGETTLRESPISLSWIKGDSRAVIVYTKIIRGKAMR